MNPSERISAAIEKLERLKAESTPGPWQEWHSNAVGHDDVPIPDEDLAPSELEPFYAPPATGCFMITAHSLPVQQANADLVVTLHRTIDAQLDVLNAIEWWVRHNKVGEENAAVYNVLKLADAILGSDS